MATPPLGFILPADRTADQAAAHANALGRMRVFTLAPISIPVGTKIILTDFLKDPDVIADMGMYFPGFRQLTGSCVGVTEGEVTAILSAIQRKLADNPTKAFIPWWPFAYARTRFREGDRGQGEGAVSSVCADTLEHEGTFARLEAPELPAWDTRDGLALTKQIEFQWSDGSIPAVTKYLPLAALHKFGTRGPIATHQDVNAAIANGYIPANGCSYFIGNAKIHGSGDLAYCRGVYDTRGGHETKWIAVWNHPTDGMLYGYKNTWAASTYPVDPAGLDRCSCWTPESEVIRMLDKRQGIDSGEAWAASHVDGFPAQSDKILSFFNIGA